MNQSGWGGHNPTTIDGPKIALRSMEEGYFVPAIVANMSLTFLVDTGSNVSILCKDLLDVWPQEHFPNLTPVNIQLVTATGRGARWLSGRVSDSGARGRGFETYRRRVVSFSKTLYSPKVLVNYPGSGGSVPT